MADKAMLYELLYAMLKYNHVSDAMQILENAIKRIDRGYTSSSEKSNGE